MSGFPLHLFFFEFQTYQRVFEGPVASYHTEDFHIYPNPGTAPLYCPHGVHEEEGAGMFAFSLEADKELMYCFDHVFQVSVEGFHKADPCSPDSKRILYYAIFCSL